MSRTGWKHRERQVARLFGMRYPANTGGPVDVEGTEWVVQVKERKRMSLAELEQLAVEIDRVGNQKGKHGVLAVKRSAGRGTATPLLLIVTENVWREMHGDSSS